MRKWKRVDGPDGPRFRSGVDAREAAVLCGLVSSVIDMLDERAASAPTDELEAITGMRTGNSRRPDDATLGRLLPDFHRPTAGEADGAADGDAAGSLNAALRGLHEPEIIDAKRAAAERMLATVPPEGAGSS